MPNLIASLRALTPKRPLTFGEALRIAELQATRLLAAQGITSGPVPETVATTLPRVQIQRMSPIPVSGSTHWAKGRWLITINGAEPLFRQRFSLAHEVKHVLDAPFAHFLYPAFLGQSSAERTEQVCDYFAACLLMPRSWVKTAWREGPQSLSALSARFAVSQMAMRVRLLSIGLVEPGPRCGVAA